MPSHKLFDPEVDGSKQFSRSLRTNYHKLVDDFSQVFNCKTAIKFTEVNYQTSLRFADQGQRYRWRKDNFLVTPCQNKRN